MKWLRFMLVLGLFLPAACEVYAGVMAPRPCTQMPAKDSPENQTELKCCLIAVAKRPYLLTHNEADSTVIEYLVLQQSPLAFLPVLSDGSNDFSENLPLAHASPPRLWVQNSSFLI